MLSHHLYLLYRILRSFVVLEHDLSLPVGRIAIIKVQLVRIQLLLSVVLLERHTIISGGLLLVHLVPHANVVH